MKYFNPSYWFKLWVLSAPLFNDKTQGINAKSIDNKKIKNWARKNTTNLDLISNNDNRTEFVNYQTYSDNQLWDANLTQEHHHHDLQTKHNKIKRNVLDSAKNAINDYTGCEGTLASGVISSGIIVTTTTSIGGFLGGLAGAGVTAITGGLGAGAIWGGVAGGSMLGAGAGAAIMKNFCKVTGPTSNNKKKRDIFDINKKYNNSTQWDKNITNLINHEQHLPINNKTNFITNNITSL